MLLLFEILMLMALGRVLAGVARAKGYNGCVFGLVFLPIGVGGLLSGTTAAGVVSALVTGGEPNALVVFVGGLAGMAVGATIAFVILRTVPPRYPPVDHNPDAEREDW